MKFLSFYVNLFILNVTMTLAATSVGFFKDPDFPDSCVLKDLDLILSPGAQFPEPNWCGVIICREKSLVERHSCRVFSTSDDCEIIEPLDANGPYPDCCPQGIQCNDVSDNSKE